MGGQDLTCRHIVGSGTIVAALIPDQIRTSTSCVQKFGYLKQVLNRKLYFNPVSLSISKDRFHQFEWKDFYIDAEEAITDNAPKPLGRVMTT